MEGRGWADTEGAGGGKIRNNRIMKQRRFIEEQTCKSKVKQTMKGARHGSKWKSGQKGQEIFGLGGQVGNCWSTDYH